MIRRPMTPDGKIRYSGVYQRCRDDCPDDVCRRHSWSYGVELPSRAGKRQQHTQAGFSSAKAAATARAELIAKHRSGGWPTTSG